LLTAAIEGVAVKLAVALIPAMTSRRFMIAPLSSRIKTSCLLQPPRFGVLPCKR
jgi:hypothetical protein